jgi:hypothetical protein
MTQQGADCSVAMKVGSPKRVVGPQVSQAGEHEQFLVGDARPFACAQKVPNAFRRGLRHAPVPFSLAV